MTDTEKKSLKEGVKSTPRTDALCHDHYYEASAEAAGMIVSAKSAEECYREAIDLCRELESALSEEHNAQRAFAHRFRDWIAEHIEDMAESYAAENAPEHAATLRRAVKFIRASEANPPLPEAPKEGRT